MNKIIISILMLVYFSITLSANVSEPVLIVKNGSKYMEITIDCDSAKEQCEEGISKNDLTKIRAVAKLKSFKSWSRLMEAGVLELVSVEYRDNKKVLTYIICNSHNPKLISNNFGSELLLKGRK